MLAPTVVVHVLPSLSMELGDGSPGQLGWQWSRATRSVTATTSHTVGSGICLCQEAVAVPDYGAASMTEVNTKPSSWCTSAPYWVKLQSGIVL